jgi:hypothetical protein
MAPAVQRLRQGGASTVDLVAFDVDYVDRYVQIAVADGDLGDHLLVALSAGAGLSVPSVPT